MAQEESIPRSLAAIEARLQRLESQLLGAKAVYVGNNRLLTRANFRNILYYVQADDRLLVPRFVMDGILEPEVTNFFIGELQADSHCLDVGANFGYYACLMGRCACLGKTLALEPDAEVFTLLRDNVFINWLESTVTPINGAAASADGTLTLHRRETRSGNTSIIALPSEALAALGETASESFTSRAFRLDSLLPQLDGRVDFLKIDVEGAEPLVLRGARELVAGNPQLRIVMEWAPAQIRQAGFDLAGFAAELAAMGLQAAVIAPTAITAIGWPDLLRQPYCNLLLTRQG